MATFPSALQIGEGATPNELDIDEPFTSNHTKRFRDRDGRLLNILRDGASAPEDLNVNNLTVAGDTNITGDLNVTGDLEFPEKALIFSAL